jgi:VWFA-related protein
MKKLIYIIITILFSAALPVSAGPFININSIDAKTDFPRVKLNLTVVDPDSRGITGLDEENILVYEDGFRVNYVKVKDISSSTDSLYLVFAIDSSKSISKEYLEKIKKSAAEIADSAGVNDRIAVLRFNDKIKLLNNFSSNKMEIVNSIKSVERHGSNTVMFDAIYDSIEFLSRVKSARKGVVVFTDGKDEGSSLSNEDVIKFGKETGVPVYFIVSAACKNLTPMSRIAKLTGGSLISCGDKSITGIYKVILSRIKNIYEIHYQSIVKRDNSRHVLEVRLKYGELKDRDTAEFTAERDLFRIDFPDGTYIILTILVILLMSVLFVLLVIFFKRSKDKYIKIREEDRVERFDPGIYTGEVSIDDLQRQEPFDEDAPKEVPDVMYSQVWLQQKDDHGAGEKFQMIKSEVTIGSASDNSIQVEDALVSEKHSRIRRIDGGYYLYDLVSDCGTFLNGRKLLRPKLLHDWDEITVGRTILIFRAIR